MKNVKVLDCTLRDGGRIIDCAFSDNEISDISYKLAEAKVDIIEVGFLRDWRTVEYKGNSTFFTDVKQIEPFVNRMSNSTYVAFVDYGMFDFDSLRPYDGKSIDGIRVGFTKKDFNESLQDIIRCLNIVKNQGYKLFVQGVNSLSYNDKEILELIDMINEILPYSFGIVDTYGAMYVDDVDRIYALIDNNMAKDICIDFHSHNNYQLSFSLAQEIIKLSRGVRKVIIDATLNGMGKVAGNLNTELLIDFLVRKLNYDYEFDEILDIIDDYIYPYKDNEFWGYSIPALMAGIYQTHPNNVLYLTQKFRLQTKDIKNLISMIEPLKRQRYDYDNIEKLYLEYNANKIDDYEAVVQLRELIDEKEVLVLIPGKSVLESAATIEEYIKEKNPFLISVNYVSEYSGYAFFGNQKRYSNLKEKRENIVSILASNIKSDNETDILVNYYGLINKEYKYFENSAMMLLNLLRKIGVTKISIAGFDGFRSEKQNNYIDNSFQNRRHIEQFEELNQEIEDMLENYVSSLNYKCKVKLITPSIFEKAIKRGNRK